MSCMVSLCQVCHRFPLSFFCFGTSSIFPKYVIFHIKHLYIPSFSNSIYLMTLNKRKYKMSLGHVWRLENVKTNRLLAKLLIISLVCHNLFIKNYKQNVPFFFWQQTKFLIIVRRWKMIRKNRVLTVRYNCLTSMLGSWYLRYWASKLSIMKIFHF